MCANVTSKSRRKDKVNTIVTVVKGTKSEILIEYLLNLPKSLPSKVKEVTFQIVGAMKQIAKYCFANSLQVIGVFTYKSLK